MYPEPDAFKPERFIDADGSLRDDSVLTSAFGFGKRVCPGRHFVDASLFIVVSSILSVFKIEKGKGSGVGPDAYPFTGNGIKYGPHLPSP
jgi:cytochrome P450